MPSEDGQFVGQDSRIETVSPDVSDISHITVCQSILLNHFITVNMFSLSLHAMIDTGADICVANPSILSELANAGITVNVYPSDKKFIVTANDEHVEIIGLIYVDLSIGNNCSKVKFYLVPDLTPQLILGIDFLHHQGAVVDFYRKKIS